MDPNHPTSDFQDLVPITAQEEKELKRVHDMLCDFLAKEKLQQELNDLEQTNDKIKQPLQ